MQLCWKQTQQPNVFKASYTNEVKTEEYEMSKLIFFFHARGAGDDLMLISNIPFNNSTAGSSVWL